MREAYKDRPYKHSFLHISAPHIYATILSALDLTSNLNGVSFLNIGAGSGYLNCLVAHILGLSTHAINHGKIEYILFYIILRHECIIYLRDRYLK